MVGYQETIQNKNVTSDRFHITLEREEQTLDFNIDIPVDPAHGGRLLGVQPGRITYPVHTALQRAWAILGIWELKYSEASGWYSRGSVRRRRTCRYSRNGRRCT